LSRDTVKLVIVLFAMASAGLLWLSDRPVHHPAGVLAPDDPQQGPLERAQSWRYRGYELNPRASFELQGRVLSATRYRWDRGASLAPVDLALGWGGMSDSAMLERLRITQGGRFYLIQPRDRGLDLATALRHSANMHMIPATQAVRHALLSAKEGSLVTLRGQLVDIVGPDGFSWRTSLRRDDTGAGACELVWVEEFEVR